MTVNLRILKGRRGLIKEAAFSDAPRVYMASGIKLPNPSDSQAFVKAIAPYLLTAYMGFSTMCDETQMSFSDPGRILIYEDPSENFISIVMCFKIPSNERSRMDNSRLRYLTAIEGIKYGCFVIYANNYQTENGVGTWDVKHCERAPFYDIKTVSECVTLVEDCKNEHKKNPLANYINLPLPAGFSIVEKKTEVKTNPASKVQAVPSEVKKTDVNTTAVSDEKTVSGKEADK